MLPLLVSITSLLPLPLKAAFKFPFLNQHSLFYFFWCPQPCMCACTCVCSLLALCVHEIILVCVCAWSCVFLCGVCVFHYALYNYLLMFSVEKTSPSFSLVWQDVSRITPLKGPLLWLFTGWQDYTEASCWLTKLLWGFLLVDKTTLRLPVGWRLKNTPWGNLAAFPWLGHRILTPEIPLRWLCPGWRDACSEPAPPHRVETHPQECDWSCTCCNTTEPSVCYSGVVGVQCWVPWCESFMLILCVCVGVGWVFWCLHWVLWCWWFVTLVFCASDYGTLLVECFGCWGLSLFIWHFVCWCFDAWCCGAGWGGASS